MSVDVIGWHRHWSSERFFGEEDVYGPMPECAAQEARKLDSKGRLLASCASHTDSPENPA
jgi:hypothetical protein